MTTKVIDRQHPFVGLTPLLGIANIGAGNGVEFKVRPGTLVKNVFVQTITAFDGTTNTATVSDGTTTFVAAADIKTVGSETAAVAAKYYPTGGTITVELAQTGAATVGAALAGIEYVIVGNGNAGIEE